MATETTQDLPRFSYSLEDTAVILGICRAQVFIEVKEGRMKSFRIGRRRMLTPAMIQEYIDDRAAEESQQVA